MMSSRAQRLLSIAIGLLAVLPIAMFYLLVSPQTVNIPMLDDYDFALGSLASLRALPTTGQRIAFLIAAQHMQYKLFFAHFVIAVDFLLTRRINFSLLATLGNLLVLPIGWALWLILGDKEDPWAKRLLFFLPVIYLLFELQYAENMDWATGGLQNIAVIAFSLYAIYLLSRHTPWPTAGACVCLMLAIAASGNGIFVALAGLAMLLQMRRWRDLFWWLATTLIMLALYFYHYQQVVITGAGAQVPGRSTVVLYFLSFLGSLSVALVFSVAIGVVTVGICLVAVRRRYWETNPALFYALVFLVLTAAGVAAIRFRLGLATATASRYRIYSAILACFMYAIVLREWRHSPRLRPSLWKFVSAAIVLSMLFCMKRDRAGVEWLQKRRSDIETYQLQWVETGGAASPIPEAHRLPVSPGFMPFVVRAGKELQQAVDSGVYEPVMRAPPNSRH